MIFKAIDSISTYVVVMMSMSVMYYLVVSVVFVDVLGRVSVSGDHHYGYSQHTE